MLVSSSHNSDNMTKIQSCHEKARCLNTVGSYKCQCTSGYAGDGFNCVGKCHHCLICVNNNEICVNRQVGIKGRVITEAAWNSYCQQHWSLLLLYCFAVYSGLHAASLTSKWEMVTTKIELRNRRNCMAAVFDGIRACRSKDIKRYVWKRHSMGYAWSNLSR